MEDALGGGQDECDKGRTFRLLLICEAKPQDITQNHFFIPKRDTPLHILDSLWQASTISKVYCVILYEAGGGEKVQCGKGNELL